MIGRRWRLKCCGSPHTEHPLTAAPAAHTRSWMRKATSCWVRAHSRGVARSGCPCRMAGRSSPSYEAARFPSPAEPVCRISLRALASAPSRGTDRSGMRRAAYTESSQTLERSASGRKKASFRAEWMRCSGWAGMAPRHRDLMPLSCRPAQVWQGRSPTGVCLLHRQPSRQRQRRARCRSGRRSGSARRGPRSMRHAAGSSSGPCSRDTILGCYSPLRFSRLNWRAGRDANAAVGLRPPELHNIGNHRR